MSQPQTARDLLRFGDVTTAAVGWRCLQVRNALGLTQDQMADMMGCKRNTYQHIERGKTYPRPVYVQRLFEAERVDHNFIYSGDPSRLPADLHAAILQATTRASD